MGSCFSCSSPKVGTAKLVFPDGQLLEFLPPAKVSEVLGDDPAWFICSSDEMEFGDVVSAMEANKEFQPGQLYFALPQRWLAQPMEAADMAALAVTASVALGDRGGREAMCSCWARRVESLDSSIEGLAVASGGDRVVEEKESKLARKLSTIMEEWDEL
ncbi:hypothetical protein NMG60_11019626 [Bertholletia excelsa]